MATDGVDPCSEADAGAGHSCGGDAGVLYACSADGETLVKYLGAGCPSCVQCPAGYADDCDGGFTPPLSCIDGL